jgi:hypothetical protein
MRNARLSLPEVSASKLPSAESGSRMVAKDGRPIGLSGLNRRREYYRIRASGVATPHAARYGPLRGPLTPKSFASAGACDATAAR